MVSPVRLVARVWSWFVGSRKCGLAPVDVRSRIVRALRHLAWCADGRPNRRTTAERLSVSVRDPETRKRFLLLAWLCGLLVGEFVLPSTSLLGQAVQQFLRGAGYQQAPPSGVAPYQGRTSPRPLD